MHSGRVLEVDDVVLVHLQPILLIVDHVAPVVVHCAIRCLRYWLGLLISSEIHAWWIKWLRILIIGIGGGLGNQILVVCMIVCWKQCRRILLIILIWIGGHLLLLLLVRRHLLRRRRRHRRRCIRPPLQIITIVPPRLRRHQHVHGLAHVLLIDLLLGGILSILLVKVAAELGHSASEVGHVGVNVAYGVLLLHVGAAL